MPGLHYVMALACFPPGQIITNLDLPVTNTGLLVKSCSTSWYVFIVVTTELDCCCSNYLLVLLHVYALYKTWSWANYVSFSFRMQFTSSCECAILFIFDMVVEESKIDMHKKWHENQIYNKKVIALQMCEENMETKLASTTSYSAQSFIRPQLCN